MNKHKANLYVQSSGRVSVNSVIYFAQAWHCDMTTSKRH